MPLIVMGSAARLVDGSAAIPRLTACEAPTAIRLATSSDDSATPIMRFTSRVPRDVVPQRPAHCRRGGRQTMFATIDALATESWASRKSLRERARLDGSLLPSDTSGCRDVRRQNHLRPVAYCTSGFDSSAQSTGSPPASARSSFARLKGRDPKKPAEADSGEG